MTLITKNPAPLHLTLSINYLQRKILHLKVQDKETLTISSLNVNPTPVGAGFFSRNFLCINAGCKGAGFFSKIVIGDILPFNM